MMSKEQLLSEAKTHQYKAEILEKVYQLLFTLDQFMRVPYLRERLVLKGGTALNLFYFENKQFHNLNRGFAPHSPEYQ